MTSPLHSPRWQSSRVPQITAAMMEIATDRNFERRGRLLKVLRNQLQEIAESDGDGAELARTALAQLCDQEAH